MGRAFLRIAIAVLASSAFICVTAAVLVREPAGWIHRPRWSAQRARPDALRRDVEFLTHSTRDAAHEKEMEAVAEYIKRRFQSATTRVRDQQFVVRGRAYRNVIASFGPDRAGEPLLVVGAHYDVFAVRARPFPGADDNASGTAGLLELARLLAANPPSVPVDLVAYANEEPPFFGSDEMGSAVHAEALRREGRTVKAMLCLEMIGTFHGKQLASSSLLQWLYPSRGNFVAVCGGWDDVVLTRSVKTAMQSGSDLPVVSFTGPRSMLDASDQRSYWGRGWPAVMITDTAYLRNPNYHTVHDTADTLDYEAMAQVVDGVFNAVLGFR